MMLEHLRTYELFANETLLRLTLLENQGYNNTNYLLESTTQNYLVRLFRANTFNRKDEFEIGKKAFKKKVAPKPLLLDTTQNLMIAQFGAGEHRTKLTPRALQSIARTLQTLHRIKHHQKPYDMLKAYKKSLSNKAFLLFKKL
ncbi:MAG: aminoglycoside phosphotransferase, partial [Sulfurospirillum sp.]|nr:aminoglycoside phosphotransferase [Sulfurospirillum sp.]